MSKDTMVIRANGGENERGVKVGDIAVPDLWHLSEHLKKAGSSAAAAAALETWHLAHDLRRHIMEQEEPTPMEALADTEYVVLHRSDLRIALEVMRTMYQVLHQHQPECGCGDCEAPMDLIVEVGSQKRNITKHVPTVIEHLEAKMAGGEE